MGPQAGSAGRALAALPPGRGRPPLASPTDLLPPPAHLPASVAVAGRSFFKGRPMLRVVNENYDFYMVFGRFPAELGPETRSNGSGLKNGAERTQN